MTRRTIALFLVLITLAAAASQLYARSFYNTAGNRFGGLCADAQMRMQRRYKNIVDDRLVEENKTAATAITLDTISLAATTYRYQLRLANLNNKQGKINKIRDSKAGINLQVTRPEWGLVFNCDELGNYHAVVLSCDNSAPFDDITDVRVMQVSVIYCSNGDITTIASTTLSKGVSLEDDLNTICVDVDELGVKVSLGKSSLIPVLETAVARPHGEVQVGYLVGPGSRVSIERAVLTIDNEKQVTATTLWTLEALDEYLANEPYVVEHVWERIEVERMNVVILNKKIIKDRI